jgi:3-mercaptopyruvate sulfurtransferase SseA
MGSYFRARDEFEPVSRDELLDRLRSGTATVLDVRPEDEFANGHLPAALNIPLAQLEWRLAELPAEQEIVAYCRAPGVSSRSRLLRCCVSGATAETLDQLLLSVNKDSVATTS